MTAKIRSSLKSITALMGLVSLTFLGACASVHPRYATDNGSARHYQRHQSNDESAGDGGDIAVASDPHYKSGTMRPYTVRGEDYVPHVPDPGYEETGLASWYAYESTSRTTADGEVFDADAISAAHKTFPLPSVVEVTNLANGKTIRVRVNDRGPFVEGRIIDLSRGAAKALGSYGAGTVPVRVRWLGPADPITGTKEYVARADPDAPSPAPSGDDLSYIVQLGAFAQKDNADNALTRLDGARVDRRGNLYVVYLGPFKGAGAAESRRQSAIDAGFTGAILRRYE